ncbi:lamin tail domain-containing protein [Streptomyces sp. NPDC001070]
MSASRITRRVIATVLASGAVVAAAAMPATAADGRHGRSSVVIGDVNTRDYGHGYGHSRGRGNDEWIEVVNTGRGPVNLRGWTLSDSDGNRYRFGNVRLAGYSKVRVHSGFGRDGWRDLYQDRRNSVWDRRDTATLWNDDGRVVDVKSWGGRGGHR